MKKIFKNTLAALAISVFAIAGIVAPSASAQSTAETRCTDANGVWDSTNGRCSGADGVLGGLDSASNSTLDSDTDINTIIKTVINTMLFIIGALSVIMLIYGGIRYTTSAGNSNSVTAAKNTIMYAIIGLVVSLLAYAIVNWVIDIL